MKIILFLVLICSSLAFGQAVSNTARWQSLSSNGFLVTSRTTAVNNAVIYNTGVASPNGDTTIRVNYSLACHTQVASATVTLTIGYTDRAGTARTISANITCTTITAAAAVADGVRILQIQGNTDVTASTSIANSPSYDGSALIEQIN